MKPQRIQGLNFQYVKTSAEIIEKAKPKREQIATKVAERKTRIAKLREEYQITDKQVIELLSKARAQSNQGVMMNMSYSVSADDDDDGPREVTIGAGVINHLLTEEDFIVAEERDIEKLDLIMRNLKDIEHVTANGTRYTQGFSLSQSELEYLGF